MVSKRGGSGDTELGADKTPALRIAIATEIDRQDQITRICRLILLTRVVPVAAEAGQ